MVMTTFRTMRHAAAYAYLWYQWDGGSLVGDRHSKLMERIGILRRLWPKLPNVLIKAALVYYALCRWRTFYDYCFSDVVVVEFVDLAHQRDAEPTPPPQLLPPARFVQQSGYVN